MLEANPEYPDALYVRGQVWQDLKQEGKAEADQRRAEELDPYVAARSAAYRPLFPSESS